MSPFCDACVHSILTPLHSCSLRDLRLTHLFEILVQFRVFPLPNRSLAFWSVSLRPIVWSVSSNASLQIHYYCAISLCLHLRKYVNQTRRAYCERSLFQQSAAFHAHIHTSKVFWFWRTRPSKFAPPPYSSPRTERVHLITSIAGNVHNQPTGSTGRLDFSPHSLVT